jgi:hypothetical protein
MHRTFGSLAGIGVGVASIVVASIGIAQAARNDVVPVGPPAACKTLPPKLLSPGRAPRAPLRLDLTGIAHHTQGGREVERFVTRAQSPDGKWHSTIVVRKISEAIRGGEIAHGQVAVVAKFRVSWPRTKTTPPAKGASFVIKGHTDSVSGGLLGGSAGNDRLPIEPVGVGATWRVVDCDSIDFAPAKEIRTYTLRSIAGGKLVASFRDVVSMDLGNREAGSQKVGDRVIHFVLDSLSGTATGTARMVLAHGLTAYATQVTRVRLKIHAVSANVASKPAVTLLVDTRTDAPAS